MNRLLLTILLVLALAFSIAKYVHAQLPAPPAKKGSVTEAQSAPPSSRKKKTGKGTSSPQVATDGTQTNPAPAPGAAAAAAPATGGTTPAKEISWSVDLGNDMSRTVYFDPSTNTLSEDDPDCTSGCKKDLTKNTSTSLIKKLNGIALLQQTDEQIKKLGTYDKDVKEIIAKLEKFEKEKKDKTEEDEINRTACKYPDSEIKVDEKKLTVEIVPKSWEESTKDDGGDDLFSKKKDSDSDEFSSWAARNSWGGSRFQNAALNYNNVNLRNETYQGQALFSKYDSPSSDTKGEAYTEKQKCIQRSAKDLSTTDPLYKKKVRALVQAAVDEYADLSTKPYLSAKQFAQKQWLDNFLGQQYDKFPKVVAEALTRAVASRASIINQIALNPLAAAAARKSGALTNQSLDGFNKLLNMALHTATGAGDDSASTVLNNINARFGGKNGVQGIVAALDHPNTRQAKAQDGTLLADYQQDNGIVTFATNTTNNNATDNSANCASTDLGCYMRAAMQGLAYRDSLQAGVQNGLNSLNYVHGRTPNILSDGTLQGTYMNKNPVFVNTANANVQMRNQGAALGSGLVAGNSSPFNFGTQNAINSNPNASLFQSPLNLNGSGNMGFIPFGSSSSTVPMGLRSTRS